MSRPSVEQQVELEQLESAAALLAEVMQSTGLLAVRLRQIGRRVPDLQELVDLAQRELGRIVDGRDAASELLKRVLTEKQQQRKENNNGNGNRTRGA